ncbi:MAG: ral secretion pathway protein [Phycisphaerales bacterium]|jgi:type II secretion system protein J|nr:ral secretion pathway protein [Phycisphaerales bacterium]
MMRVRRGFTLIEITLALGMAAMLALTMYTALSIAQQARRNSTAAVDQTRSISIAGEILRHDFESVLPPVGQLAGPFVGVRQAGANTGGGDADQIEFFSVGEDEPARADDPFAEGIRKIQLLVRTDAASPVLVRRVTRNLMPTVEPAVQEEIICRNVRSFSVKYFDGLAWQENWDSTTLGDVLPMSVAVTLEVDDPTATAAATAAQVSTRRVTRIFPLSCAKPVDLMAAMGGGQ